MKGIAANIIPNLPFLIGIDEAGRGPIAGPVAVGAFAFLHPDAKKLFRSVRESKQLVEKDREKWFARIENARTAGAVNFAVAFESHEVIDAHGLTFSIKRALATAIDSLALDPKQCEVRLDGLLKAPAEYIHQRTIIDGDAKEKIIALASICAKVLRDRHMREIAKLHPEYSFDTNKGYGTEEHYLAIRKFGLLPIHRRRFLTGFDSL